VERNALTPVENEEALVKQWRPLVLREVRRACALYVWLPPSVTREDLESVGMLALLGVIRNYDASSGYSIYWFAWQRIRNAIINFIRATKRTPGAALRRKREVNKARNTLRLRLDREPTLKEIADSLGVDPQTVTDWRQQWEREKAFAEIERLRVSMHSGTERLEYYEQLEILRRALVELGKKKPKWQDVLYRYYWKDETVQQIADAYNQSIAGISQMRSRALTRLRAVMLSSGFDASDRKPVFMKSRNRAKHSEREDANKKEHLLRRRRDAGKPGSRKGNLSWNPNRGRAAR
jgi:RNA polymerase sigma factor for flagellar operon FliA